MFISTLRTALGILAGALVFAAAPASAATLTITDDNCSDFAVGGTAGARTLTCLVLAAPVCTPTANPTAGTFGSSVTITANCTNQPQAAGYVWTGGSCASSTGSTCTDSNGASAPSVTYTVQGRNNVGLSETAGQVAVAWSSTPPPPPSPPTGCTLTANPSSLTASGVVLLTAACSGGGPVTNYAWTSNPVIAGFQTATTAPTNTQSITVPATTTFTMTAYNGSAAATQASKTVTVGTTTTSSLPATCGSLSVLNLGTLPRNGNPIFSSGFTGSKIAIATLNVTGSNIAGNTLSVYEYGSAPTNRKATLSKTVCDTAAVSPYYQSAQGPTFNYSIGGVSSGVVNMVAGETWYLMIRNEKPFGGSSCTSGSCDIGIKWYP